MVGEEMDAVVSHVNLTEKWLFWYIFTYKIAQR